MERYWVYSQCLSKSNPAKGAWNTEVVKYADAQAQLEAVRRERDEVVRIACGRSAALVAEREKVTEIEKALAIDSGKTTLEKVVDLKHSFLQAWVSYQDAVDEMFKAQRQLDAERTRREQVEMANYAKDGQIETLQAEKQRHDAAWLHHQHIVSVFQAELATLKRLVWALPYQTGNITKLNVEGLTILDAQPFVDLLTYRATLEATPVEPVKEGGDGE